MSMFFTGCTHFDHANIIRLANRPFASAEEMNETMVERWNAKVKALDTVYHLGDFGFIKEPKRAAEVLARLNGKLHLIHGNHDHEAVKKQARWVTSERYAEVLTDAAPFVLFHYPVEEWNGFFRNAWHVHAHTHRHEQTGAVAIKNRVNVTVEAWGYAPAHIDEVLAVWPAPQAAVAD